MPVSLLIVFLNLCVVLASMLNFDVKIRIFSEVSLISLFPYTRHFASHCHLPHGIPACDDGLDPIHGF